MWNEVEFLATWHFANVVSALKQRSDKMNRLFYTQMGVEIWFSPTLLDILATLEFHIMNPLELQVYLSQ